MKRRMIVLLCVTPFLLAASALLAYNFHILLSGEQAFTYHPDIILAAVRENEKVRLLSLLFAAGMLLLLLCTVLLSPSTVMHSDNTTVKILPNVRIPAASGHGEYGTAWFMSEKTLRRCFAHQRLDRKLLKELTKEANANETDTERSVSRMG